MKNKNLLIVAVVAVLAAFLNAGCNTIEGAGKDIEKAGDKVQNAADKNR